MRPLGPLWRIYLVGDEDPCDEDEDEDEDDESSLHGTVESDLE